MDTRILQINFTLEGMTPAEFAEGCRPFAKPIAAVPGLRWKIWLVNDEERRAGGIYQFDDERTLRDYLDGPIIAAVRSHPHVRNLEVRQFSVMPDLSAVTRAPLAAVPAGA
jgi:hypothetical protein